MTDATISEKYWFRFRGVQIVQGDAFTIAQLSEEECDLPCLTMGPSEKCGVDMKKVLFETTYEERERTTGRGVRVLRSLFY